MQLKTTPVRFQLNEGILTVTYKKGLQIDTGTAEHIVQQRLVFTEGKTVAVLIISEGVVSMTKAAREYLASKDATTGISASAILTHNVFSNILGNFFMKVNKPAMPVKLFTNRRAAEIWLQQFTFLPNPGDE